MIDRRSSICVVLSQALVRVGESRQGGSPSCRIGHSWVSGCLDGRKNAQVAGFFWRKQRPCSRNSNGPHPDLQPTRSRAGWALHVPRPAELIDIVLHVADQARLMLEMEANGPATWRLLLPALQARCTSRSAFFVSQRRKPSIVLCRRTRLRVCLSSLAWLPLLCGSAE